MPRLIVLLLILAALIVLAVQNLSPAVALVILSGKTIEIPFGLLLLGAVCLGALVTLLIYALVGLQRPPESKYRPMGRRVPYPESPGSTTLPNASPSSSSTGSQADPNYSRSSAFVSEPAPAQTVSSPQDSPPRTAHKPFVTPPPSRETPPSVKKKSDDDPTPRSRRTDDDWGDRRTPEQRNSWDAEDEDPSLRGSAAAGQTPSPKRGLFDFIRPGNTRESPDRLADDIASGWESSADQASGYAEDDRYRRPSYQGDGDELDQGWESFDSYDNPPPPSAPGYTRRVYADGLYGADSDDIADDYADLDRDGVDQMGPDGVYEADYRVIAPPTRPLDDDEEPYSSS
ncbi:hypothetical protein BH23CYA1_BH23CYA1_00340 [soil metagenome]